MTQDRRCARIIAARIKAREDSIDIVRFGARGADPPSRPRHESNRDRPWNWRRPSDEARSAKGRLLDEAVRRVEQDLLIAQTS